MLFPMIKLLLGGDLDITSSRVIAATIRVMTIQVVAGLLVAVSFFVAWGAQGMLAAAYGTVIGIMIAFVLSWSVVHANARHGNLGFSAMLYWGAVQRFILVSILFLVGLKRLDFAFLPMIIGFGSSQLAYLFSVRPK